MANSNTMLNKSCEGKSPYLFVDFIGNAFSPSLLSMMLGYGLPTYGLYHVEVCSLYTHIIESFYLKWMLNFVKSFVYICSRAVWFLLFDLLMWCIILTGLWKINFLFWDNCRYTHQFLLAPWILMRNYLPSDLFFSFIKRCLFSLAPFKVFSVSSF